ncbi:MAG TPA: serine/threonine-protein kinase, partial [Gemmatimonadales bacterium]|nr:serine/threonine-protein kinase [Gemmatimonadales bacterium]
RYHVLRRLGEGGMGEVWLAEHVRMGRKAAIKVLPPGMSHDQDAVSRFNREAASAARISHPHVCTVYDFGTTEQGQLYLAMEYLEGGTLGAVLKSEGPLALPRASRLLSQCADALQAAHDLGIVHRDLKPDNIMIVAGRTGEAVKVVDFGIAKAMTPDKGQQVTRTGLVVGTPEYMSPEQLAGDALDGRSDLYSLALVFYRMVTGVLPFQAGSAQETMVKRLTESPRSLADGCPGREFPAGLQAVMDRALDRDPGQRYRSVSEFGQAVDQALSAASEAPTDVVDSRPDGRTVPPTRATGVDRPRSRRTAVFLGIAAMVVAGGGLMARGLLTQSGTDGAPPAEPAPTAAIVPPADTSGGVIRKDSAGSDTIRHPPITSIPQPRDRAAPGVRLPSVEALSDPATRDEARRQAEAIYARADVSDSLRAAAAATVAHAYVEDARWPEARTWAQRAFDLRPSAYRRLLDQINAQLPT